MTKPAASVPGLVLAGGRSSRMGENKALMQLGGRTLLQRVTARLAPQVCSVSVNASAASLPDTSFPLVPDGIEGQPGPLAGILAGLETVRASHISHLLTVPIDSPFLPIDLAIRLRAALQTPQEIVIAASAGREHPVFGLWPVGVAEDLRHFILHDTRRSIRGFLDRHDVRVVDFPLLTTGAGPLDPFFNINSPDDIRRADVFLEYFEP